MKPIRLFVIQPTSFCNLNCRYCYVPNRRNTQLMEISLLEIIAKKISKSDLIDNSCTILWHSGEPLSVGLSYFKEILKVFKKYNLENQLKHTIQTNGTLINDDWCKFFIDNNIEVGISVDGPDFIHDTSRVNWKGSGSHAKVMRGIGFMKKHGLPLKALAVVTLATTNYPSEFFNFFLNNGFEDLGLNFEEIMGENKHTSFLDSLNQSEIDKRYVNFIDEIFKLWINHHEKIRIREFFNTVEFILNKNKIPSLIKTHEEVEAIRIVSIRKDGAISLFSPELVNGLNGSPDEFVVDYVQSIECFSELYKKEKFIAMNTAIQNGVQNCKKLCPYFEYCGGGSPASKMYETKSFESTKTNFCQLHYQRIIDRVFMYAQKTLT